MAVTNCTVSEFGRLNCLSRRELWALITYLFARYVNLTDTDPDVLMAAAGYRQEQDDNAGFKMLANALITAAAASVGTSTDVDVLRDASRDLTRLNESQLAFLVGWLYCQNVILD